MALRAPPRLQQLCSHLATASYGTRFRKVLIANRGEIAIRISRAARELGIESAGVYTDSDAGALHPRLCDTSHKIPNYLDIDHIVSLATQIKADCVHPGYGFLSERPEFAAACDEAGIVFIGPKAETISLFGNKTSARNLAKECGVPCPAGSPIAFSEVDAAAAYVVETGMSFPLLLKAVHGGGGRGIRRVGAISDFAESFERCSSESRKAFGLGDVFVEELIDQARHIEVQIAGDINGQIVHLFERDCSVQIRNQKIIEICPAVGIAPALRERLTDYAVSIAKGSQYLNVGTVEFLVQGCLSHPDAKAFFLEVNPRIQVEHTITEQQTSVDLVRTQFELASGSTLESLRLTQPEIRLQPGYTIQSRISLVPGGTADGTVTTYREPGGHGVRVDSCAFGGLVPATVYDPMFAKIIVTSTENSFEHGVLVRTKAALSDFFVDGVQTNQDFVQAILNHPRFVANDINTMFVTECQHELEASKNQMSRQLSDTASRQLPSRETRESSTGTLSENDVVAGLSGSVVKLLVQPGDMCNPGDPIAVITSMKMEITVRTNKGGKVTETCAEPADIVGPTTVLVHLDPEGYSALSAKPNIPKPAPWQEEIKLIHDRRDLAKACGGHEAVTRHHQRGFQTIRERIDGLVDVGSFRETGRLAGGAEVEGNSLVELTPSNFVLGTARINERPIVVGGEDFTIKGGSPSPSGLRKSVYTESLALQLKIPLVRLHEGGGGSVAGGGGGDTNSRRVLPPGSPVFSPPRFQSVAQCLQTVPVASAALGAVAGLPASRLVASHFSVMTTHAAVLTAGPKVVARALGYDISKDELGGAAVHAVSGVIDNIVPDEDSAFTQIRTFLSFLPQHVGDRLPVIPPEARVDRRDRADPQLSELVPRNRREPFEMREAIERIFDVDVSGRSSFFEIGTTDFGKTQITGLARLDGHPVAVFANDGKHLAGAMTWDGSQKVQRLLDLAELFGLPVISLLDEPGFMIGVDAEKAATIRHGTRLVLTAQTATVPWAVIHVRKAYGVAAAAHFGPDAYVLSWPSAEHGTLPVESGVAVAFSRHLREVADLEGQSAADAERLRLEEKFASALSPFPAAHGFGVHDLIDPKETRLLLCEWLDLYIPLLRDRISLPQKVYRP